MPNKDDDPLVLACHRWRREGDEFIRFIEDWFNVTIPETQEHALELQKWSQECHEFSKRAVDLRREIVLHCPGLNPDPIDDFSDQLDSFFCKRPETFNGLESLWSAFVKAKRVIGVALKALSSSSSNFGLPFRFAFRSQHRREESNLQLSP